MALSLLKICGEDGILAAAFLRSIGDMTFMWENTVCYVEFGIGCAALLLNSFLSEF